MLAVVPKVPYGDSPNTSDISFISLGKIDADTATADAFAKAPDGNVTKNLPSTSLAIVVPVKPTFWYNLLVLCNTPTILLPAEPDATIAKGAA